MTNNKVKPLVHWSLHWIRRILECVIKKVLRMGNRAQMVQTAVRSPGDYCQALHCGQSFVIPSFQSKVRQWRTIVARMSPNGRHCFFFIFFKKISLTSSAWSIYHNLTTFLFNQYPFHDVYFNNFISRVGATEFWTNVFSSLLTFHLSSLWPPLSSKERCW